MAAEIISQRNVDIIRLVGEVGGHVADLARWPESDATKNTADNSIKLLRKALREAGYPHAFMYWAMLQIAGDAYSENVTARHPEVSAQALKQAWIKIADILHKD